MSFGIQTTWMDLLPKRMPAKQKLKVAVVVFWWKLVNRSEQTWLMFGINCRVNAITKHLEDLRALQLSSEHPKSPEVQVRAICF